MAAGSLRSNLKYQPRELQFGTSGRRGKVADLTQLEIYINALAELEYLQSLDPVDGGIRRGGDFFWARDLRPSSSAYVAGEDGRGEIAQAIIVAIADSGMTPVNLGCIPTPALACYALAQGEGCIMVTGSHIPFDRNGYKTYSSRGELRKQQEDPINRQVQEVRQRLYGQPFDQSLFDGLGRFKSGHRDLGTERCYARDAWIARFTDFFKGASLAGKRLLVYQHSAVGRDIMVEILRRLGAEVIPAGRSETFVPIDTENIGAEQLAAVQELTSGCGPLDAIVSTDGDSDRPLVLGVDAATGKVRFFGGDLLGMVVAEYLQAGAVVVPVSCNDAIDRGPLARVLEAKTRIGSPFVIEGMEKACRKGKKRVCGWEPNGGFLTASDFERNGRVLTALPTRDAMLPILCALFAAQQTGQTLAQLFDRLPKRFSRAALLPHFARSTGLKIVALPGLSRFFPVQSGFAKIDQVDYTDGVRIRFDNGDVVHVRPSGNADELRIYAVADSQARADAIAAMGIAEPDGILRRMAEAADPSQT